jgi:SAM-dependent methyltransferase
MNAPPAAPPRNVARDDLLAIAELVAPGTRVLDVGCGDGSLLTLLEATRGVDGRGIEISQKGVNECVARGLSVIQGDADTDLVDYPDDAFDFVHAHIEKGIALNVRGERIGLNAPWWFWNLFGQQAVFLLSR